MHNRTCFMKVDTKETTLEILKRIADKFGISHPAEFCIMVPSVMDVDGTPMWMDHNSTLNSVYLADGGVLQVKRHPQVLNVFRADCVPIADYVKTFDPDQKGKFTFKADFNDSPLDLVPLWKTVEGLVQKDVQYVFMCVIKPPSGPKTSFFVNSQKSLYEQKIPDDGNIVLYPFSQFMKLTAEQLAATQPELSGYLIKSSIKNDRQTPTKRRWCVLKDHFLYYFKGSSGSPSGVIPLEFYGAYQESDDPLTLRLVANQFDKNNMLMAEAKGAFLLKFESQKQFEEWFPIISQHCSNYAGKDVFGLSLSILMARKSSWFSDVPEIAYKTFNFLSHEMDSEGLFRLSGLTSQVDLYRNMWNMGIAVDYEKEKTDPHTVASLFKKWLREMPDPLLTHERYSDFVQLFGKTEREKLDKFPKLLNSLPTANKKMVMELNAFAYKISEKSEINKMTAKNLAIVFGPNLLQTQDMNQMAADSAAINDVTEFMIAHHPTILNAMTPFKFAKKSTFQGNSKGSSFGSGSAAQKGKGQNHSQARGLTMGNTRGMNSPRTNTQSSSSSPVLPPVRPSAPPSHSAGHPPVRPPTHAKTPPALPPTHAPAPVLPPIQGGQAGGASVKELRRRLEEEERRSDELERRIEILENILRERGEL